MTDEREEPPAAIEGSERLRAIRDGREAELTVAQLRRGLQPASPALAALAAVEGVGALRRIGADQFAAGPLPLSLLARDGAEPGEVLAWNGTVWAPAPARQEPNGWDERCSPRRSRRVDAGGAGAVVIGQDDCGTVLCISGDREVTVLLPASLPAGSEVTVLQAGAGLIRFVAAPGAALANRLGHARTAGRHARVELILTAGEAGGPPLWTLSGDTGP